MASSSPGFIVTLTFCGALLAHLAAAAPSARARAGFEPAGCVATAASFQPPPPTDAELRKPMSEHELELVIRALEPVKLRDGEGQAIRAVTDGGELSPDRLAVLVADATSLLAELKARETLEVLGRLGATLADRRLLERDLRLIGECTHRRFADRGDDAAYSAARKLVKKYQARLEPLLLAPMSPDVPPRPGPR